jgi:hypothetical protein
MSSKKPLSQQPMNRILDVATLANSPYEKIFYPQNVNTPINKSLNISQKLSSPIRSSIPNENVLQVGGLQMLPEEPVSSEDDTNFLGSLIAQGVAGIGTGLMGGTPRDIMQSANMFDYMRNQQTKRNKSDLLMDPKSEESKKRRLVFKNLGYDVPEDLSYTDLGDSDVLRSLRSRQMEQPKLAGSIRQGGVSGVGKPEKEKKNPFQKEVTEISIRSKNALDSLGKIENIVRQYGTRELTGSQEKELEQLIQNVAVNYNKVLDPTSVVREGEAKQVAESLGLGGFGSYFTNKDTALRQVQSFRDLITNSRNNALSGYSNLPSDTDFNEKDQFVINEYRKNPDDPRIKELYNDMLSSKGLR